MLLRQQHILLPNPSLFLFFSEFLLIFEKVEKISEDNDDIFLLTSKNSAISSVFFIVFLYRKEMGNGLRNVIVCV